MPDPYTVSINVQYTVLVEKKCNWFKNLVALSFPIINLRFMKFVIINTVSSKMGDGGSD